MKKAKSVWFKLPNGLRKPIVLIVGLTFLFASLALGWLPGVSGILFFVIGVSILATEFEWASRFRIFSLKIVAKVSDWYFKNKMAGTVLLTFATLLFLICSVYIYELLN